MAHYRGTTFFDKESNSHYYKREWSPHSIDMNSELVNLEIDISKAFGLINDIIARLSDFRPAWDAMHHFIRQIVIENFKVSGRPEKWPERKDKKDAGWLLLRKTGKLYHEAISPSQLMKPLESVWTAHVGIAGVVAQYGSDNKNIPPRPYFMIPPVGFEGYKLFMTVSEWLLHGRLYAGE